MALPVDYNTVTITGRYVYLSGEPVTGTIKFTGKVVAMSVGTNTIIVPTEILAELDVNGEFSVALPATDDPDIDPNGWTYTVVEQFPAGRTYEIDVPVAAAGGAIDISTVAPVTAASGDPTAFVTLSVFEEHTHTGGSGGGAVDSVNGKIGVVVLNAADVGAAPTSHMHAQAEVTGLATTLSGKAATVHTHAQADVTGLTTALSGKAATVHTHAIADTTGLQTSLDAKAPLASPTFSGTVAGITKSMVGLSNVDNTADIDKPISTVQQAALDAKAPLASPTFTGTVAGVSKAMVGLGNVDNTSDVNKPISTATQTALDAKAVGAASSTDNALPRFDGTTGKTLQGSGVTINDSNDVSGVRAVLRSIAADYGVDYLDRIDLGYLPATTDMDLLRVYVQGAMVMWMNEIGFVRGTPRSNYKDDAVLRGRARSDLVSEQGGYIELENSASQLLHRRRWRDGALVRGNGSGTVVCSDVLVLNSGDPIPAGTPTNTVIVRLS